MKICAVIPAFNNGTTVSEVVEKTQREIDHVVVVDGGSTDETALLAEDTGAHVIRVSKNKGKGNVLRIGFRYALANDFDAIITLDADLQHDPSEIPKLLNIMRPTNQRLLLVPDYIVEERCHVFVTLTT